MKQKRNKDHPWFHTASGFIEKYLKDNDIRELKILLFDLILFFAESMIKK